MFNTSGSSENLAQTLRRLFDILVVIPPRRLGELRLRRGGGSDRGGGGTLWFLLLDLLLRVLRGGVRESVD